MRRWEVGPQALDETEAPDMMTPKARRAYEREKARELKNEKTASMLNKSGSIDNTDNETTNKGGKSLGRFRDSQSGH